MAGGVISNKKPCHSLDWFFCEVEVALRVALYCILFRDVIKYSPPLYHINQILPPFQSFCKLLLSCLCQRLSLVWLSPVEFRNSGNCRNYGQRCRCMAPPLWKSGILEIKRIMGRYDISLCRKLLWNSRNYGNRLYIAVSLAPVDFRNSRNYGNYWNR